MRFFIQGGYYDSLEDVARLLLLAAEGSQAKAQIALRRAVKAGVYAGHVSDDMLFLVARKVQLQHKKPCSDFTAIKKSAGRRWRTLYRKYEKRGLTLRQIARLHADRISDKTTPTF